MDKTGRGEAQRKRRGEGKIKKEGGRLWCLKEGKKKREESKGRGGEREIEEGACVCEKREGGVERWGYEELV